MSPLVLPLMEQLGLLEDIKQFSKPFGKITVLRDDMSVVGTIVGNSKNMDHRQRYGHYGQCITRPDLYNVLLSKIPKERLHLGKRFVNYQNMIDPSTGLCHQVQVRCSDGSLYSGEVLVGADGASSAVRQSLFRWIKEESSTNGNSGSIKQKPLPKQDEEPQHYKQVALVGVTNPLNGKRYPDLQETFSQFKVILSKDSPYMSWFMPVLGNRYCWLVTRTLEKPVPIHNDNSRDSEWGPVATDEMTKTVRHLKGPDENGQGTVGDLIDATDRQLITKVMLEERVFKTWYGGRTVLLGDACHKSVPFTGKGASESMLDAVALASLLHDNMPQSTVISTPITSSTIITSASPSLAPISLGNQQPRPQSIRSSTSTSAFTSTPWTEEALHRLVFKPYYQARISVVREVVDSSSMFSALLVKEGWLAEIKRKIVFALQDSWVGRPMVDRAYAHRIQATFLKLAPDRGSIPPSQSRVQLVPASRKSGDHGKGAKSATEGEGEDLYQDMGSPEARKRLDMQLLQLQQEQEMQFEYEQLRLRSQQRREDQLENNLRNLHPDLHAHSTLTQERVQVDEFMTGQSSRLVSHTLIA
ncbi:hypothetical protein FBU30_002094 [Linnemannia zychae]|nr:hypothetical protein FBU30_002094 [Linnemannia zychae]